MNRRSFIKSSCVFASSAALASFGMKSAGANSIIQLGVIGCGRQGRDNIRNLLSQGGRYNAVLTAVCDADILRAEAAKTLIEDHHLKGDVKHGIKVFEGYTDLISDPSIDAVIISTPDHSHGKIAIAAAEAGKDIFLEKPLTYTLAEGLELIRSVRSNHCILQTGTQQRSEFYFRRVCELARNGRLGTLERIEVRIPMDDGFGDPTPMEIPVNLDYRSWLLNAPQRPYTEDRVHPQSDFSRPGWMQVSDYSHGMITNWGSHMLDIAQWGGGYEDTGPVWVDARAEFNDRGLFDVHQEFSAINRYADGVELHITTLKPDSILNPGVKFVGSAGWADCIRGGFNAYDRNLLRWEPTQDDVRLNISTNHIADFLSSLHSRQDPVSPVETGHRSNSLCVINLISAKLGRPIHWDPHSETFGEDDVANRYLTNLWD